MDDYKVEFMLRFKASVALDEVLRYVKRVREVHPDAKIRVEVGVE